MREISKILILILCFCGGATAGLIQVNYTATLATVGSNAFGLTSADQGRTLSGYFLYDTATPDTNASSGTGDYQLSLSTPGFSGVLGGATTFSFTGTLIPTIQIVNTASGGGDSFRFTDGPGLTTFQSRFMSVNGAASQKATLSFYISSSFNSVISSDALPTTFAWGANDSINFPHTFALSDGTGNLLFQLKTVSTQASPEPASIGLAGAGLAVLVLGMRRRKGVGVNDGSGRLQEKRN